jgi:hypothetical protein
MLASNIRKEFPEQKTRNIINYLSKILSQASFLVCSWWQSRLDKSNPPLTWNLKRRLKQIQEKAKLVLF